MEAIPISLKRSLLLSARVQFSPQTQPIRETAIDKIVEQTMFAANPQEGMRKEEILSSSNVCFKSSIPTLRLSDIDQALRRLEAKGRVSRIQQGQNSRYELKEVTLQE